ncbi:MAG TPA: dTMP kinase [Clostridiales bacterium]|nr:dTMP kinase [Clostridiales bacterium]
MEKLKLKSNTYPGKLIVFEGTDGAGKTTMINLTKNFLREKIGEEKVVSVKQPTDMSRKTKLFQKMMYCKNHEDVDYRAVQLLTMSDRIQHGSEIIIPALKEGKIVVCDRYIFTSLSNMLARGYFKEKWFFDAAKNIVRPDITFLAYTEPDIAIKRIKSRPEECDRFLDEKLLRNVSKIFYKMAKKEKFTIVDTSGDPETAFSVIKENLEKKVF